MATNAHGGGGRNFTIDNPNVQERLANIRGMANDGRGYHERTGQAPLSEQLQTVLEEALGFIGGNWKLLLVGAVALVLVLRK